MENEDLIRIRRPSARATRALLIVSLLAAVALGFVLGREHAKWQMRETMAETLKALGTGFPTSSSSGPSSDDAEQATEAKAELDTYRPSLKLYGVRAGYEDDLLDGRVAVVRGKLQNSGNRTLSEVQVTAYFLDSAGNRIYEDDYHPVLAGTSFSLDSDADKPLKPSYIRSFGFKAAGCPKEWKPGAVRCEVTGIRFADE